VRDSTKTAAQLAEQAFITLQRTADAHLRPAAGLLKEFGLSPTQYNVLRILRGAGKEGLTCTQIGDRMINRDPDITRLLDRMEARGWVKRERQTTDRRVILATLSDAGLELVDSIDEPLRAMHADTMGRLGAAKLKVLIKVLEEVRLAAVTEEE
jgi:DNA-binding MarR family transcriptional regulator